MGKINPRKEAWLKRQKRVRRKVRGTADQPRLNVFRSARHIYAQIIDDASGHTLAAASSLSPEIKTNQAQIKGKVASAKQVGLLIASRAKEKGISKVVFDRNGFLYHGRVAAVAEGAREGGLDF